MPRLIRCVNYVMTGTLSLHDASGALVAGTSVSTSSSGPLNGILYPSLAPGLYYAEWVESNADCHPIRYHFLVPTCTESPGCCPTLNLQATFKDCDAEGKRPVSGTWTIVPSSQAGCPPINGTLTVCGQTIPIVSSQPLTGTFGCLLAPGSYSASLVLTSPAGCNGIKHPLEVPPCDCCPTSEIATFTTPGKCDPDNLTKHIVVCATVTPKPGCPVSAVMSVDGKDVASGTGSSAFTLKHEGDYGCGQHTGNISYSSPGSTCPPTAFTFCVSMCETFACEAARWLLVVVGALALAIVALAILNPGLPSLTTPAILLTIVAFVLFLVWFFSGCRKRCFPCPLLLLFWQTLAAGFICFLLLSKTSYLNLFVWLGGTLFAILILILVTLLVAFVIYLFFLVWVARCCPTKCDKLIQLLLSLLAALAAFGFACWVINAVTTAGVLPLFIVSWLLVGALGLVAGLLAIYIFHYCPEDEKPTC